MKHWTLQLAEFFFTDFWRWLGLVILVGSLRQIVSIKWRKHRSISR